MTTVIADNPYWNVIKNHIDPIGSLRGTPEAPQRHEYVARYSWTITDPETVAFVAEHSRGRLVDPMAGTGWWAWVLAQADVDTVCYDLQPGTNHWHEGRDLHTTVSQGDGAEVVRLHADRTLLLSWPPYDAPDGADILAAYAGDRVIYMGEGEGGCTGDDTLHEAFATHWAETAHHVPVQWMGLHDVVTVYDRKG